MINKLHMGKRLASLRRRAGISQTALADRLGVTSQAVSKWECGNAIPDIELLLSLSHLYGVSINEMLEEDDLLYRLTGRRPEQDGIAYFVPKDEPPYAEEWADAMKKEKWIARNWDAAQVADPAMDAAGARIASLGGTILEIGAGPGGGYVPYILKADPDAAIILSDISPTVVREWKAFLDARVDSPNMHYAAFDFCQMPFRDGSISVISDRSGIGNCIGDQAKALKEAFRVLKPGGVLVSETGFVDKETLAALPPSAQRVLQEQMPEILDDLYEDTVLAGFRKIDSVICGEWYTNEDDSKIANLARSLGINLKFTGYIRFCTKEE